MNGEIKALLDALRKRLAAEPELARFDIASLAQPSIRLVAGQVEEDQLGLGVSRIGGIPDVPPGWEWPRWTAKKVSRFSWRRRGPRSLGFIAQIDLAKMPRFDDSLPASGWLYFFYDRRGESWGFDPADRGCCRVEYANVERASLVNADVPGDLDDSQVAFPCAVAASLDLTVPHVFSGFEFSDAAFEAYLKFCEDWSRRVAGTQHRLLGLPDVIQNPMELECQLASNGVYVGDAEGYKSERAKVLADGAGDWRLLLQIDTDEQGPGWMWGDAGVIYFWIKRQDLKALRFDDAWLILQCG
jgi:uncharacterized protein YwqG